MDAKKVVRDFWDQASCGEALYLNDLSREAYLAQSRNATLSSRILEQFADFGSAKGKKSSRGRSGSRGGSSEIRGGRCRIVGSRSDAEGDRTYPAPLSGTWLRLEAFGGRCREFGFGDGTFDIVYSWGVLHHSPDTPKALFEVWRVFTARRDSKDHDLP